MSSKFRGLRVVVVLLIAGMILVPAGQRSAGAARPAAEHLLPERTVVFLRIADRQELVEQFQQTALGRIGQDPQIGALLKQLYGSAVEASGNLEQATGLSLDELLALPQGEFCFAIVAPPTGAPAVVLLVEVGERSASAKRLLDSVEMRLINQGFAKSGEILGDTELKSFHQQADRNRSLAYFQRDGVMALMTNTELAKEILLVWNGQEAQTLADSPKFSAIMRRSLGTKDEPHQLTWFVDPIELFRSIGRGNPGAQIGLAMLPSLGLDGLQGIGGSVVMATEEFDILLHTHVLLNNPRHGVLEMAALEARDTTPENWVPVDAASYMTLHWNFEKTYAAFRDLYDDFRGDGALAADIRQRISDPLDVDFERDLLSVAEGPVTYVSWMEPPARVNSQSRLIGIKVNDSAAATATLERIVQKYDTMFQKSSFGGVPYYQQSDANQGPDSDSPLVRRADPCIAILGEYLLLTDSSKLLHQAIMARSDTSRSLASALDYKLVASKISRLALPNKPCMIRFTRPEKGMQTLYDLAASQEMRDALAAQSETSRFSKALFDALNNNPLPPFPAIAKHLAPGGGLLTDDDSGFHYISFSLRRN